MSWFNENGLISRFFSSSPPTPEEIKVEEGDCFFQVGMGSTVWVVERLCASNDSCIQHVVITRKGFLPGSKIISAITLVDTNLYRRDLRVNKSVGSNPKKRRCNDRLKFN